MNPLSKNYFNTVLLLILSLGIFLRYYGLSERPLHHDESLHAHYSYAQTTNFKDHHYKYNPMLHGPLLYDLTSLSILLGGNSKSSWRFTPALFGCFLLLLIAFFTRHHPPSSRLILLAIFAISPMLLYWSRFLRNEALVIFFQLALLYALLQSQERWRNLLFFPLIIIQFTLKENAYITALFIAILLLSDRLFFKRLPLQRKHRWLWIVSLIVSLFLYVALYSSFFSYPAGIIEGLYKKSLIYWFNQHQQARIDAPFAFLTLVFIHNAPIIFLSLICTICWELKETTKTYYKNYLFYIPSVLFLIFTLLQHSFLQIVPDYLIWLGIFISLPLLVIYARTSREKFYLFFLFIASYFTYSYVGEKVPWLALYPYTFSLLYMYWVFKNKWQNLQKTGKIAIVMLYLASSTVINYQINYSNSPQQIIHQVASTPQLEETLKQTIAHPVLVYGDIIWPLHTLLESNPFYKHHANRYTDLNQFDYVFLDDHYHIRWQGKLRPHFQESSLLYREYWWPKVSAYNWKTFFLQAPWSPYQKKTTTKQYLHFYKKLGQ